MSLYVICYELITLQKDTKMKNRIVSFKVYLFTLHTIRVRHSAAACTGVARHTTVIQKHCF